VVVVLGVGVEGRVAVGVVGCVVGVVGRVTVAKAATELGAECG